jgi:outer membrane protein TolC
MKKIILFFFCINSFVLFSQEQLSLQECYTLVNENYPLAKQIDLLKQQNDLDLDAIKTDKLPQFDIAAQATYQSAVTEIPIPNSTIEPLNNDQYRATLTVNQLIYGGGLIDASSQVKAAELKTKQKQVEVSLYQLKKQVNQLYFSILLQQQKKELLIAKKEQLESKLKEVQSGITNGALLPASDKVLEAELLKIKQQFIDVDQNKTTLIQTLSSFIGKEISEEIILENPNITTNLNSEISRPELELFELKKQHIESSESFISKQNSPKLFGFGTGGYGNPGLNMIENDFTGFYIVGVKFNWEIFDWNQNKKQQQSLAISKDIVDNEAEIFDLNTRIELNEQEKEIQKINAFILSDANIIELRKQVLQSAESQLRNGVITSSAYITELTNLYEDENTMSTHKIQLLLAQANYNITKGEITNEIIKN